jgi:hypothetical protein
VFERVSSQQESTGYLSSRDDVIINNFTVQ